MLGILKGRSGIPREWVEPIGESIRTVAVNPINLFLPENLTELTDRVIACKMQAESGKSDSSSSDRRRDRSGSEAFRTSDRRSENASRVLARSSRRITENLPYGTFAVEYENGPEMRPERVRS